MNIRRFFVVLMVSLIMQAYAFAQINPADLIAHYPLDGNAADVTGNGHDGTLHGTTPTSDRFGCLNSALDFDGIDDYVDMDTLDFYPELSISFWVKFRDLSKRTLPYNAMCGPDLRGGMGVFLENVSSEFRFYAGNDCNRFPAEYQISDFPSSDLIENSWHHIVVTYSSSTEMQIYLDGQLVQAETAGIPSSYISLPQFLGTDPRHPGTNYNLDGALDELYIFDKVLSAAEVEELYTVDQTLLAYYPFSGNAEDSTANANHGIVNGAVLTTDRFGNANSAYAFDGIDDYIELTNGIDFDNYDEQTLAAWVQIDTFEVYRHSIVAYSASGTSPFGQYLLFAYDDYSLEYNVRYSGNNNQKLVTDSNTIANDWVHIATTKDDAGMMRAFVNGVQVDSFQATPGFNTPASNFKSLIGAYKTPSTSAHLQGKIDEVRIYKRALTPLEIQEIYLPAPQVGNLLVSVELNGIGQSPIGVSILDTLGIPIISSDSTETLVDGTVFIEDLPSGDYLVSIFEPLGLSVEENPLPVTITTNDTANVNFAFEQAVINNTSRTAQYWKRQFRLIYKNKPHKADYSEQELLDLVSELHNRYNPHFDYFEQDSTIEDWFHVLRRGPNPTQEHLAKRQIAALLFNLLDFRVVQIKAVTADSMTAGDVLTYASVLLADTILTNDVDAKRYARKVNRRKTIKAGKIPAGTILYKVSEPDEAAEISAIPESFTLEQNYPNPFNPTTTIRYRLPRESEVTLTIYDLTGREVIELVNEAQFAGEYSVALDASNLASGVYLYRLKTAVFTASRKMMLVK